MIGSRLKCFPSHHKKLAEVHLTGVVGLSGEGEVVLSQGKGVPLQDSDRIQVELMLLLRCSALAVTRHLGGFNCGSQAFDTRSARDSLLLTSGEERQRDAQGSQEGLLLTLAFVANAQSHVGPRRRFSEPQLCGCLLQVRLQGSDIRPWVNCPWREWLLSQCAKVTKRTYGNGRPQGQQPAELAVQKRSIALRRCQRRFRPSLSDAGDIQVHNRQLACLDAATSRLGELLPSARQRGSQCNPLLRVECLDERLCDLAKDKPLGVSKSCFLRCDARGSAVAPGGALPSNLERLRQSKLERQTPPFQRSVAGACSDLKGRVVMQER